MVVAVGFRGIKSSNDFPQGILRRVFGGLAGRIGYFKPLEGVKLDVEPSILRTVAPVFPIRRHSNYRARGLWGGGNLRARSRPPSARPERTNRCDPEIPTPAWPSGPCARPGRCPEDRRAELVAKLIDVALSAETPARERVSAVKALLMAGRLNIEAIRTAQASDYEDVLDRLEALRGTSRGELADGAGEAEPRLSVAGGRPATVRPRRSGSTGTPRAARAGCLPGECREHPRARPSQRPPAGDWRTWLVLMGRGFGEDAVRRRVGPPPGRGRGGRAGSPWWAPRRPTSGT